MPIMNTGDNCPEGRARFAVRGFKASRRASRRRLEAMATVRAVTMQTRMRRSWPIFGRPCAARKVASSAQGRAKSVWESLMSAAKVLSFVEKEDSPPGHGDTEVSVGEG